MNTAVAAGAVSTGIFAMSSLPMVAKAMRTRDLSSYSLANLVMANVGNLVYAVYVVSLPLGPVWGLHAFNGVVAATMLVGYVRFRSAGRRSNRSGRRDHRHDGAQISRGRTSAPHTWVKRRATPSGLSNHDCGITARTRRLYS
jgi:hypothetical protein